MKTHITLSHSTDKPFPCPKCDKYFARACDVKSHKKIHEDVQLRKNSIPCKICGMNFSRNSRLVSHQKIHTRHVTFECSTCAKKFLDKSYLAVHMKFHTGARPYTCPDTATSKPYFRFQEEVSPNLTHLTFSLAGKVYHTCLQISKLYQACFLTESSRNLAFSSLVVGNPTNRNNKIQHYATPDTFSLFDTILIETSHI